jgi:hypothetical protein
MNKFWILPLLFLCNCGIFENVKVLQNSCFPIADDHYVYPLVPGTEEWRQLSSTDEAFQVCQLPDNILKSISTPGLIDALIHSPMFTGFYLLSSSSPVEFWHNHYSRNNSAQELFERENSGDALVAYYKSVDIDCIKSATGDDASTMTADNERLFGLEFLFTKQEILVKIGHQKKQELVEALLSKYNQNKENRIEVVPMAWVMRSDAYAPMLEYYSNNKELYEQSILLGYVSSTEQSNVIVSMANNYINKK